MNRLHRSPTQHRDTPGLRGRLPAGAVGVVVAVAVAADPAVVAAVVAVAAAASPLCVAHRGGRHASR